MNAPAHFPLSVPKVVHETAHRLRVRLTWLDQREVNIPYLRALLEAGEDVRGVRINRKARTIALRYDGGPPAREALLARLAALGPAEVTAGQPPLRRAAMPQASEDGPDEHLSRLVTSALTLVALPFLPYYLRTALTVASTWKTLWKGAKTLATEGIKVEVLDAIAVGLATSRGQHYTANATHLLLNAGEYLEHQTGHHAEHLVKSLLRPTPTRAWVERDGNLVQVAGDAVREGEVVVVGPGDPLPVDGRILSGTAQVNQASLTGEGLPVRKEQGHPVLAGSVVEDGRLRVQALQVGNETTTARITRVIEEALTSRSHTQRLAERLADQRVYLTLGLGAGTYVLTRDPARLEAVFLVDYSCALKLGTPVAFKSGMYKAAQRGVLFKGAQAMEDLAQVDTVIFDKTGTLTYGQLEVTDVLSLREDDVDQCELLALVASLEEHANHPLADAIVRHAQAKALGHVDHGHVDFIVAHGLKTRVEGQEVLVGSRHYLEEHEGVGFARHQALIDRLDEEGKHLLYVAAGGAPLGLIALRDTPRPEVRRVLHRLRSAGVRQTVMLTGDTAARGRAMADALSVDTVRAELRPEEKAGVIEEYKRRGRSIAFVGDGVNDAPALAAAHVGVAMPRGALIARETADVILLQDDLAAVADARDLATRTQGLIRTNFQVAAGVNSAIILAAALGRLSPVAASVLHNGTTLGILLNALSGVSLSRDRTEQTIDRLKTLREAYRDG